MYVMVFHIWGAKHSNAAYQLNLQSLEVMLVLPVPVCGVRGFLP